MRLKIISRQQQNLSHTNLSEPHLAKKKMRKCVKKKDGLYGRVMVSTVNKMTKAMFEEARHLH